MVGTGNGQLVVHVMSLYGISGSSIPAPRYPHSDDNEALLQDALLVAASLGNVPVLLGGDLNSNSQYSDILGRWKQAGNG